jgi:hypothetical protein
MWKRWRVLIVAGGVTLLCGLGICLTIGACETAANDCIAKANLPPVTVLASKRDKPVSEYGTIQTCRESQCYLCRVTSPANLPNIILVLVGLIGIIAAFGTLNTIQAQTELAASQAAAARQSADLALLNTNAVVHGQRPWLLIETQNGGYARIDAPNLLSPEPGLVHRSACNYWLKNSGTSPARTVKVKAILISNAPQTIPTEDEVFGVEYEREGDFTSPQGESVFGGSFLPPNGLLSAVEIAAIMQTHTRWLYLCGHVKYMDTFERKNNPTYQTNFCYRWVSNPTEVSIYGASGAFWMMVGPISYNRAS